MATCGKLSEAQHERLACKLERMERLGQEIVAELEGAGYPLCVLRPWRGTLHPTFGTFAGLRGLLAERAAKEQIPTRIYAPTNS
jgi:hypothetical protein